MSSGHNSIGQSDYADRARKLIDLVNNLRAFGAQEDVDLPRIAVIGNQSAGKSSLVEAISRIKVPRASGTCTRCPMECRLKYSQDPWQAQVLLRRERHEDGTKLNIVHEIPFGPPLTDEQELESRLKRAQLAILNPHVGPEKFVDLNLETVTPNEAPFGGPQLSFSSNVVCVDISSPLVTDLAFIDLPGLIANVTEGEDESSISLIKDLVQTSIQGNTLILSTITMRDDIQNQSAAMLARKVDPDGSRTIGVLTKPDSVAESELYEWFPVLSGMKHKLQHGYFVTKQPGPDELSLNLSFDDARARETEYFSKAPWRDLDTSLRNRVGTQSLTKALSSLLSGLINQTLPKLRADARASLGRNLVELAALPPPPSSQPFPEMLKLLNALCDRIGKSIIGTTGHKELMRSCREIYEQFKRNISATHPHFKPFPRGSRGADSDWTILLDETDDHVATDHKSDHVQPSLKMNLSDMREYIQRSRTRELPLNVPYSSKTELMDMCFEDWEALCLDCFVEVHNIVEDRLTKLTEDVLQRYPALLFDVRDILDGVIAQHQKLTVREISNLLSLEEYPFTLNDHYYLAKRSFYLARFKEARVPVDPPAPATIMPPHLQNQLEAEARRLQAEYEQEMVVMAECEAYYRVAYKRIIDNLPRVIDQCYLRAIPKTLQPALMEKFGGESGDPHALATSYLREDENVAAQREELIGTRDRLDKVLKALAEFNLKA